MDVNKLAGLGLIILAIINALHEYVVRATGRGEPGFGYAVVTALFFTFGAVLLVRQSVNHSKRGQKKRKVLQSSKTSFTSKVVLCLFVN